MNNEDDIFNWTKSCRVNNFYSTFNLVEDLARLYVNLKKFILFFTNIIIEALLRG